MEITGESLYVGNLHPNVDEAVLNKKFLTIGPIHKIHLCRNSTNYVSLGYAYVTYYLRAHAEEALDTMNFDNLMNRPMRMAWANSDSTLRKSGVGNVFIKNLHEHMTDIMLYDTFVAFGEIISSKVARYDNNRSKGHAFIHYVTEEAANKAIEKVNGMSLMGKIVYVGLFKTKYERPRELTDEEPCFNNVYVKNFREGTGEKELSEIFGKIGEILSVKVMTDESGKSKGFGFVTFKHFDSAKNAVSELNGKKILPGGKPLCVTRAIKHVERQEQLKLKYKENVKRCQDCKIYVGYLEKSVDEERLRQMFQPFGTVVSATVRFENGVSRGFGFVSFSSPQEAEKAITIMDKSPCGRNKLKVSLAERKDERQAFLNYQRLESLQNPHFDLKLHSFPVVTGSGLVNDLEQPGPSSLERETVTKNVNEEIDLNQFLVNSDEEASTSSNSTSCNRGDETGSVAFSDLEQPGPSSLGHKPGTKNRNGLGQRRRQCKKSSSIRESESLPINEGSIPQNEILSNHQGGQLNQRDRKSDFKNASRKQKVSERAAVETTSSTTVNNPIKSRYLNANSAKSMQMPTINQPSTSRKQKPQYSAQNVDGQRDRRQVRTPLTIGSFITFKK